MKIGFERRRGTDPASLERSWDSLQGGEKSGASGRAYLDLQWPPPPVRPSAPKRGQWRAVAGSGRQWWAVVGCTPTRPEGANLPCAKPERWSTSTNDMSLPFPSLVAGSIVIRTAGTLHHHDVAFVDLDFPR